MSAKERGWITASIREVLLPALYAQGFEPVALTDPEKKGELRAAFPFGRLRRAHKLGLDVAEIQMARHGAPAFRISVGVVPLAGINHPVGYVPAEEVWSSHLLRHYVLYELPLIQRWFSLWHWPGRQVTERDVWAFVTATAKSVVPEIESALRDDQCGKHVRRMGK
jgi:hypothetical protein